MMLVVSDFGSLWGHDNEAFWKLLGGQEKLFAIFSPY